MSEEDEALEKACQLICKQTEELVKLRIQVEDVNKLRSRLIITDQQKEAIYADYVEWFNHVFDDLEDKSSITAKELVDKVLELVQKKISVDDKLRERQSWRDSVEESGEVVFVVG